MKKRGRPIKPDAKRDRLQLRLSSDEAKMLAEITKKTGKSKTELLMDFVKSEYERMCEQKGYCS